MCDDKEIERIVTESLRCDPVSEQLNGASNEFHVGSFPSITLED
jgi:hypothetical protein